MAGRVFDTLYGRTDPMFGGRYRVSLQVFERIAGANVAGSYKTRLCHTESGLPIREAMSGSDGAVVFSGLAKTNYYAIAFDHGTEPQVAGISDQLVLEWVP